ncbi:hypothetical protein [Natrinema sp. 1APR25-10V2]|uniref:hypothetical protein n=1 Tax=Natrinema sp. 1APR25-10V2 TaxID=2951081 RepID=UPI002876B76B|nr:hypothetical protein [Natrinema sp. 1APR25-10V2]MDS0475360.1 hypothetical protein [Natrinema sp. 1APR25-10V2]
MTDTPTQPTTEPSIDSNADQLTDEPNQENASRAQTDSSATAGFDPGSETVRRYLAWGALAVCSLLAIYALTQFYGSVTDTIDLWVDPKYQPPIRAAFNLAVLLSSLIGVSLVVRELN